MKFNVVSIALPRNNACGAIVRFVDAERALLRRGSEKLHHGHQVIFELAVTVLYAAVGTGPAIETDARAVETIASPVVVAIIKPATRTVSSHLLVFLGRVSSSGKMQKVEENSHIALSVAPLKTDHVTFRSGCPMSSMTASNQNAMGVGSTEA